ncbi:MAG: AAA family ATPase, partial [Candidatus Cloacimonadota bacterium]|nr:AAA family ATPase [Candidatus Cloacimonadota bacterium]
KYPVIKLGFAGLDYDNLGLNKALDIEIDRIAKINNIILESPTFSLKFIELIKKISEIYNNPTVILIDEYDKPIIDYLEKETLSIGEKNRQILKTLFSGIKDSDKYIKFLFITGVSKFSKVSFFSELNNLTDITIDKNYSTLTGYTETEIIDNYADYLHQLEKEFYIDRKRLIENMKLWYNGYSWDAENFVYNPFSILTLFQKKSFNNYWFNTGTPTFLTKLIREKDIDIEKFESSIEIKSGLFDSYNLDNIDIYILLFQTGYLTLKEKIIDPEYFSETYKLAYPNKEVMDSFYDYLIGEFTGLNNTIFFELVKTLQAELEDNNFEQFIIILKSLYSDIPSNIFIRENEGYYHTIIFLILKLLKADIIKVEKQTNQGRVDAVIFTKKYIFVIEFKMNNVNAALKQIKEKKYYEPYLSDERKVFCVGVAFDKKNRNIKEYKIKTVEEMREQ